MTTEVARLKRARFEKKIGRIHFSKILLKSQNTKKIPRLGASSAESVLYMFVGGINRLFRFKQEWNFELNIVQD
jgi:hypothetical protein